MSLHSFNRLYNVIIYGIPPYIAMISRAGFQSSGLQHNREFMADLEISSPRNALAVLHQTVNSPSYDGHTDTL